MGLWVMDALTLSAAVMVYLAANGVAAFVAVGLVTHGAELRLGVSLKLAQAPRLRHQESHKQCRGTPQHAARPACDFNLSCASPPVST